MRLPGGREWSLRARLTVGVVASFALLTGIVSAAVLFGVHFAWTKQADEHTIAAVKIFKDEWDDTDKVAQVGRKIADHPGLDDVRVQVREEGQGGILYESPTPPQHGFRTNGQWIVATRHAHNASIYGAVPLSDEVRALAGATRAIVLFAAPMLAGITMMSWLLVGRTLKPLTALATQAQTATADALHLRLAAPSPDTEMRYLVHTLNGMLERISADTHVREQFYAAAAHELRTPLAVLSGDIEVALMRERSADDYRETLWELQAQTRRLIRLSEGLLTLNRLEMRTTDEIAEEVDIADECDRVLRAVAGRVAERELRLRADLPPGAATIIAPPSHVAMLTRNLVENAVKYAPKGGRVTIDLAPAASGWSLQVYNDYENPERLDVARFTEAFYRADASRAAQTGGNGLGLMIAGRVARQNGWELRFRTDTDGVYAAAVLCDSI